MSNLKSFDLIAQNIRLQGIAKVFRMKGTVKFGVEIWKFDQIDDIVIKYNCSYIDMNDGNPISESISSENIEKVFEDIKIYFLKLSQLQPK